VLGRRGREIISLLLFILKI
jgi:hypothetical protein